MPKSPQKPAAERLDQKIRDPRYQDETLILLDREEAAAFLGFSKSSLAKWEVDKPGYVPHVRIGSSIRYKVSDLRKFIDGLSKATGE